MKRELLLILLVAAMVGGCTHNLTKLDDGVYGRTTNAHMASITPEGNLRSAYHGVGATQIMQDPNGNWSILPGPVAIVSFPLPGGGKAFAISPKDVTMSGFEYTPQPDAGKAAISIESFEANISTPLAQYVEALNAVMPTLAAMTKEEALARIEMMKAAGEMAPTVADMLVQIITLFK